MGIELKIEGKNKISILSTKLNLAIKAVLKAKYANKYICLTHIYLSMIKYILLIQFQKNNLASK